jgi:hypothetical protein
VCGPRFEYGPGSHGNGNGVGAREDREARGDREALKGLATFGLSLRDKGFAWGVAVHLVLCQSERSLGMLISSQTPSLVHGTFTR